LFAQQSQVELAKSVNELQNGGKLILQGSSNFSLGSMSAGAQQHAIAQWMTGTPLTAEQVSASGQTCVNSTQPQSSQLNVTTWNPNYHVYFEQQLEPGALNALNIASIELMNHLNETGI
jgi:hypothetical protein